MLKDVKPYDAFYGFDSKSPSEGDLLECYVQKWFPKGIFLLRVYAMESVVEQVDRREKGIPLTPSDVWREYQFFPFKNIEDAEKSLRNIQDEQRETAYLFVDGKRHIIDRPAPPGVFRFEITPKMGETIKQIEKLVEEACSMDQDEVLKDVERTLYEIYVQHRSDREAYKAAVEAKGDEKKLPSHVKETFVKMALEIYDRMSQEKN